jgi:hypothetical protein
LGKDPGGCAEGLRIPSRALLRMEVRLRPQMTSNVTESLSNSCLLALYWLDMEARVNLKGGI